MILSAKDALGITTQAITSNKFFMDVGFLANTLKSYKTITHVFGYYRSYSYSIVLALGIITVYRKH